MNHVLSLGLPDDAVQFYALTDGACLHEESESGGWQREDNRWWKWVVIPSHRLVSLPNIGYDLHDSPLIAHQRHWVPVADVMDGNYLAISTEPGHVGEVIDCFHETLHMPEYNSIVARSFTEMLESLLARSLSDLKNGGRGRRLESIFCALRREGGFFPTHEGTRSRISACIQGRFAPERPF